MIYSVKGELVHTSTNLAVIECGGVGYGCRTTLSTLSALGKVGSQVKLYTYLHVREDAMELFGFSDTSELESFKLLISVSGVGPKAALSILSDISPQGLAACIASSDSKTLTRSQGIGAKIAQRIVLELKGKMKLDNIDLSESSVTTNAVPSSRGNVAEAISALMVLGFTNVQAADAIPADSADLSVEELVKIGLRKLAVL